MSECFSPSMRRAFFVKFLGCSNTLFRSTIVIICGILEMNRERQLKPSIRMKKPLLVQAKDEKTHGRSINQSINTELLEIIISLIMIGNDLRNFFYIHIRCNFIFANLNLICPLFFVEVII